MTGRVRIWEISVWLTERSRELSWFQGRGEAYWKERSVIRREYGVDEQASVTGDNERVHWGIRESAEPRRSTAAASNNAYT